MESIGTYPYLSYLDSAVDAPLGTVVILNDPSLSLFTDEEIARMTTQFRYILHDDPHVTISNLRALEVTQSLHEDCL